MAASGSFGSSSLKLSNLNLKLGLVRPRTGVVQSLNELKIRTPLRVQHSGLLISRRSEKPSLIHVGCSSVHAEPSTIKEGDSQETVPSSATSQCIPSPYEVESLITDICDTTSIAEFDLKLGGFRLYVKRDLIKKSEISLPAPVSANSSSNLPDQNGSVSSPSSAISKPLAASSGIQYYLDRAADEGFVIIQSPRVGFFRRSKTIKGKRAPPPCNEKQKVKEGQVLCYIEQLGGELPIESDVSGEVIKILREDGDPVGYGDALIAILPS